MGREGRAVTFVSDNEREKWQRVHNSGANIQELTAD
jgi:hypothetical protein